MAFFFLLKPSAFRFFEQSGLNIRVSPVFGELFTQNNRFDLAVELFFIALNLCVIQHAECLFSVKISGRCDGIYTDRFDFVIKRAGFFVQLSFGSGEDVFAGLPVSARDFKRFPLFVFAQHPFSVVLCDDNGKFQEFIRHPIVKFDFCRYLYIILPPSQAGIKIFNRKRMLRFK